MERLTVSLIVAVAAALLAVTDAATEPSWWSPRTRQPAAATPPLSIMAVTEWPGDNNKNMEEGISFIVRNGSRVELWGSSGPTSPRWASLSMEDGVHAVSAMAADVRNAGTQDILIQGSDGAIYYVDVSQTPKTPQRVSVERGGDSAAMFSLKMKHPNGPQLAIASLGSPCGVPDLVYVNEDGALLRLQLQLHLADDGSCSSAPTPLSYVASVLVEGDKHVDPYSIVQADTRGNCLAELLYVQRHHSRGATLSAYDPVARTHRDVLQVAATEAEVAEYGVPTVMDVDGDGSPDIVWPYCSRAYATGGGASPCAAFNGVRVFYNTLKLRAAGGCTAAPEHAHGFHEAEAVDVPISSQTCSSIGRSNVLTLSTTDTVPLLLRTGDYNRDGRVDAVVPSSHGPLVLTATGAKGAPFSCRQLDPQRTMDADDIPFFASLSEPGLLDIAITRFTQTTRHDSPSYSIAVSDRMYYIVSSAAVGEARVGKVGAAHFMGWQDVRMNPHVHLDTQQGRALGHSLQSPRVYVGIGETFTYAQGFTVGVVSSGAHRVRQWPVLLVPNTQVFATLSPLDDPSRWTLQLYLPTRRYIFLLGSALGVALVAVGVPIVWLRWREMRADYRDWKHS